MKKFLSFCLVIVMALSLAACGSSNNTNQNAKESKNEESAEVIANSEEVVEKSKESVSTKLKGKTDLVDDTFDTSYEPQKDTYKMYFTYKNIHAWYDAIEAGIKAAVSDLAEKGVTIDYEWYAPAQPDAVDQVDSIETAVGQGWDLIAVDVNQEELTTGAINAAVEAGVRVATFGTVDLPNSDRSFFVGNGDPYADGVALAEAVIKKMDGKGQLALLSGTIGATAHELRLQGFMDVAEKYPDIEIVDEQRDDDSVEKAIQITESWLQAYPDLKGILCNNMSNPIGACQAVKDAGKSGEIIIGGMDHDLRAFEYLKDGTLYVAQVQNCYDMGYKMIFNAIKAIDGVDFDEVTDVGSKSVYQDEAEKYINLLY